MAIPTLLAALTFADLPCTSLGFPTRIYIQPLMPWVCYLARRLWHERQDHFTKSKSLHSDFLAGKLAFLRQSGQTWMSLGYYGVKNDWGWSSWAYQVVEETHSRCSPQVQAEIGQPLAIVLFPMTLSLLRNFDPIGWAEKVGKRLLFAPNRYYSAQKMLRAQVMILDASIHLLVYGRFTDQVAADVFEERGERFREVVSAIVESTKTEESPNTRGEGPAHVPGWLEDEWQDDQQHSGTDGKGKQWAEGQAGTDKPKEWSIVIGSRSKGSQTEDNDISEALVRMLKLRSLFYLAFLVLGPDSSDLYDTMGESEEIPMV